MVKVITVLVFSTFLTTANAGFWFASFSLPHTQTKEEKADMEYYERLQIQASVDAHMPILPSLKAKYNIDDYGRHIKTQQEIEQERLVNQKDMERRSKNITINIEITNFMRNRYNQIVILWKSYEKLLGENIPLNEFSSDIKNICNKINETPDEYILNRNDYKRILDNIELALKAKYVERQKEIIESTKSIVQTNSQRNGYHKINESDWKKY